MLSSTQKKRLNEAAAEKKRFNRKIKTLEAQILRLQNANKAVRLRETTLKKTVVTSKATNKALSRRLIAAEKEVEKLEIDVEFQAMTKKKVESHRKVLSKKVAHMVQTGYDVGEGGSILGLKKQIADYEKKNELFERQNTKLLDENNKLTRSLEILQSRNDVLRAQNESKKTEMEVKKIELKMKHEELMLKRDIQKTEGKMAVEKQKVDMAVRQMKAKCVASEATNVAKVHARAKEADDKAASYAKRKKSSYFGSNMVSLKFYFLKFRFFFFPNTNIDLRFQRSSFKAQPRGSGGPGGVSLSSWVWATPRITSSDDGSCHVATWL